MTWLHYLAQLFSSAFVASNPMLNLVQERKVTYETHSELGPYCGRGEGAHTRERRARSWIDCSGGACIPWRPFRDA